MSSTLKMSSLSSSKRLPSNCLFAPNCNLLKIVLRPKSLTFSIKIYIYCLQEIDFLLLVKKHIVIHTVFCNKKTSAACSFLVRSSRYIATDSLPPKKNKIKLLESEEK